MLKERHREKEEYINRLAQDKEEMKVGAPSVPGSGAGQGWGARGLSASPSRSNCWSCRSWCSAWYSAANGRARSWPLPRTLLGSPLQHPQPKSLAMPMAKGVSRALGGGWVGGAVGRARTALRALPLSPPKDLREVSLTDNNNVAPPQGEALQGPSALENPTAQQIIQLLREIQNPQKRPGLGNNPCIPFFYRADDNDEVKIMVV